MLTSTPKKADPSEACLIQCLIGAESLENNQRIAVFGRFAVGFKRDIFQQFRRRVAVDMQRIAVCLQKEMFCTAESG